MIKNIKKRDGALALFDTSKIMAALEKSFLGTGTEIAKEDLCMLSDGIVNALEETFGETKIPSVEDIQNMAEKILMEAEHYEVAKAYILYRNEREKKRAEKDEVIEITVTKSSGKKEKFSLEKIRKNLRYFIREEEESIDTDAVVAQCQNEVYDGITTEEVRRALIMVVRSMIEIDPAYSKLAARLLLDKIYREVFGMGFRYENIADEHKKVFSRNIKNAVANGFLDERMLAFDTEKLSETFHQENDYFFEYMGLEILSSRYLMEDTETKKIMETPQMFWMRVAMGTAMNEKEEDRERVVAEFYEVLSNFYYTPGGRTLFQAGAKKAQLANCFVNVVPDSLDSIFKSFSDNAQYLKWSGGTGTSWTPLRATGAPIKGTGVNSQGIIPFLKIANDVNVAINRSGKRRGAGCVYLETWHLDIEDFLELRKNTGDERRRTHDINTANWVPDLFMKRVRDGGQWTLFSPHEVPELHEIYGARFEKKYVEYERMADEGKIKMSKRLPAADLWKKMLAMLFETGHPWITWKDPCNIRSPQDHVGTVHSSNLCTEITLNTSSDETAVCTLGSLNFAKFITNGKLDNELIGKVVKSAVRMLDNVIDINFYPTEDAEKGSMRHRPVGLGIRGYHDALYLLGIPFASKEAVDFADESMEIVSYYAILASSELARERGTYSTYAGSKWERNIFPEDTIDLLQKERGEEIPILRGGKLDWTPVRASVKKNGMRNSNVMAIAPTASTANLVGCIPCVEPIYKNIYVKSNKEGDFIVVNKYLVEDLKSLGLWDKKMLNKIKYHDGSIQEIEDIPDEIKIKHKEVFEIGQRWIVEAAARRAKWIDQSQSINIFFNGTSGRELSEIYFYAWKHGLKTTYYLRTLSASQVEKSTISTAEFGSTHNRKRSDTTTEEHLKKVASGEAVGLCESCEG
ncbi:MAG: ribonucleoside-diphosphate reductase subunit alpha [Candidatus Parcubacteria bacterium]|nr:ribonucleoside-diphosphate reductase subunit alpha [Candidatus Parcubacteria bacterium]